ncbi:aldehyde dehydrogenase family protein [Nitrospirillum amazonense]|uniref:aldehyde dehydrogenase family protein n=1 Tax=Nitrospirillum amazonense TaxID=28077 RepID=UPI002DD43F73|nr:aldehyde dehydrogenase family protein [Nitrospirillum amazonense]MEC4590076.1 aldehyde dehydrogenase family protein [Nitrospirillum amazonense]
MTSAPFLLTIGGEGMAADGAFPVIDPATGEPFEAAPDASEAHLDLAVAAARAAFLSWRQVDAAARRAAMRAFADAIRAETEALAALLTREQGKPLTAARREVAVAADRIEGTAALDIGGGYLREGPQGPVRLDYVPMGVVGVIAPWNAPLILAMQMVAQALAAGNAVVVKPSPFTPLATLRLGEIAARALPAGLVNTLSGGDALGRWMTTHPGIDKIAFIGSTATGKKVMASAAATLKRVSLELGGNDAAIVLDDVDVAAIVPRLFTSAFVNSGQLCMAVKRVYAQAAIADALAEALAAEARRMRLGNGLEADIDLGPVQNRPQFDKVLAILQDARARGGRILAGGGALDRPGYFIAPTIVTGLAEGARLVDEEQFGPVLPILTVDTEEEAVARANATRFGLGASVWSGDQARAEAVARQLEAGTVWINGHGGATPDLPFGGFKESGIGRGMGVAGLRSYAEIRVVHGARA